MGVFVVGGDSLIGRQFAKMALAAGVPTRTTSRRNNSGADSLDLAHISPAWGLPQGTRTVVMCAAMTSVAACETDPTAARIINLEAPRRIAQHANEMGAAIIFLSTSLVFGNPHSAPLPEDRPNPMTTYGETKALAEETVLQTWPQAAIVRIIKVVHRRYALFTDWQNKLQRGQVVTPIDDLFFSPVGLEETCEQLLWLALNFKKGIFHLAGDRELSYAEAARKMADCLGYSQQLVASQSCVQSGIRNDSGGSHLIARAPNDNCGPAQNSFKTLRKTFAAMKEVCQ